MCAVLTGEDVSGSVLTLEIADTPAQQPLRLRYLESIGQDPTTNDEIKKYVLFVGGLKVPVTKMELRSIFEPFGDPVVSEMGATNRGYVFIDLRTTESRAIQACLELSGEEFFGNRLKVEFKGKANQMHLVAATREMISEKLTQIRWKRKETWDKVERGEMVDGDEEEGEEGKKEDKIRKYQLYVDGIREPMSIEELGEIFVPYGRVGRLAILDERFFTFVDLETTQARAIDACLEISGREYCGNVLRVQFSKRRGQERITQLAKAAALERLQAANAQIDTLSAAMGRESEYSYFSRREDGQPDDDAMAVRVELPQGVRDLIMAPSTSSSGNLRLDDDSILPR